MTTREAYQAMIEKKPVVCDGIKYKRIDSMRYKYMERERKVRVFAEMFDGHSLVSAAIEQIREKDE